MPIYEYACSTCGHRFEQLMRIGADAPPCPACSATDVRRLISSSGFILKGGGWYKDHYGLKSSSDSSSSGSSGSSSSASKPSDSKPSDSKPSTSSTTAPAAK